MRGQRASHHQGTTYVHLRDLTSMHCHGLARPSSQEWNRPTLAKSRNAWAPLAAGVQNDQGNEQPALVDMARRA
jgi:hypothetical protein